MIIVCGNCSTRLQIDDSKSPSRPFTVRCPKCNSTVNADALNPASEQSALGVGGSPSTGRTRLEPPVAAPAYQLSTQTAQDTKPVEEALRMLAELLSNGPNGINDKSLSRQNWQRRRSLICVSEKYREALARSLAENGYEVHVAEDTRQAVETMRANKLDIVFLEPEFDLMEQGAAFVVREISVLRPAQRRRLFFVLISPSLRTLDAHSAFLNNVNAVINLSDIEDLPRILETGLREYNELYSEFNAAFSLSAI